MGSFDHCGSVIMSTVPRERFEFGSRLALLTGCCTSVWMLPGAKALKVCAPSGTGVWIQLLGCLTERMPALRGGLFRYRSVSQSGLARHHPWGTLSVASGHVSMR